MGRPSKAPLTFDQITHGMVLLMRSIWVLLWWTQASNRFRSFGVTHYNGMCHLSKKRPNLTQCKSLNRYQERCTVTSVMVAIIWNRCALGSRIQSYSVNQLLHLIIFSYSLGSQRIGDVPQGVLCHNSIRQRWSISWSRSIQLLEGICTNLHKTS